MFVMLLALSSADLVMADNIRKMQEIVNQLERMLCDLNNDCEDYSYHLRVNFSGERGRPKIVITQQMLDYFLGLVSQHLQQLAFCMCL